MITIDKILATLKQPFTFDNGVIFDSSGTLICRCDDTPTALLILTALENLINARKWQPIETAPKNGTRILLRRNTLTEPVTVGFWGMVKCGWETPLWGIHSEPVAWQPLPDATV